MRRSDGGAAGGASLSIDAAAAGSVSRRGLGTGRRVVAVALLALAAAGCGRDEASSRPPAPAAPVGAARDAAALAELAGEDVDGDGVRDDVGRFIEGAVPESARLRAALRQYAAAIGRSLVADTRAEAVAAAQAEVRAVECLGWLGNRKDYLRQEVRDRLLDTEPRLRGRETFSRLTRDVVLDSLPRHRQRAACAFDVESLAD